jgi:hypothetical protein
VEIESRIAAEQEDAHARACSTASAGVNAPTPSALAACR